MVAQDPSLCRSVPSTVLISMVVMVPDTMWSGLSLPGPAGDTRIERYPS